ncbi:hypothetical protein HYZ97_04775 [Candidatus Pacearchaeota archaeon]|nr:hypothetical protein [Candidatus Pacearchaeota archaeon]
MSRTRKQNEYEINLELEDDCKLRILLFNGEEHRWIFSHNYTHPARPQPGKVPRLINATTLVVNYDKGIAQGINLSMKIERPDKRGKAFYLGIDVSPESYYFIEFEYEKQGDLFRMSSIEPRLGQKIRLDSLGEGLVKPVQFPFPLEDRVKKEHGEYKVPFLSRQRRISHFVFPAKYQRTS